VFSAGFSAGCSGALVAAGSTGFSCGLLPHAAREAIMTRASKIHTNLFISIPFLKKDFDISLYHSRFFCQEAKSFF
jgi:hypothetical protein